ncbi:hypothetical protein B0H10DRAFT_2037643 [Mycena sp. CBHHK59/15]|nr:hypothetical protein B0H10DRAFT_2037643 [Mycena sp. CBHHK59/15]
MGNNDAQTGAERGCYKGRKPLANIRCLTLDLSSLAAVRKAAAQVNAYPEPIHVLINNAAAAIGPYKVTVDGLESQIATDHIGAFLFTSLISRKLLAAKRRRTRRANTQGLDFAQMQRPDAGKYDAFGAYNEAKSANVLFAAELSRRAAGKINAYSVSPGAIFTNIQQKPDRIIEADGQPNPKNLHKPGSYLHDCNIAPTEALAKELWSVTEKIVGEQFNI